MLWWESWVIVSSLIRTIIFVLFASAKRRNITVCCIRDWCWLMLRMHYEWQTDTPRTKTSTQRLIASSFIDEVDETKRGESIHMIDSQEIKVVNFHVFENDDYYWWHDELMFESLIWLKIINNNNTSWCWGTKMNLQLNHFHVFM